MPDWTSDKKRLIALYDLESEYPWWLDTQPYPGSDFIEPDIKGGGIYKGPRRREFTLSRADPLSSANIGSSITWEYMGSQADGKVVGLGQTMNGLPTLQVEFPTSDLPDNPPWSDLDTQF